MNINKFKTLLLIILLISVSISCEKNKYNFAGVVKDYKFCNIDADCKDGKICAGEINKCVEDPCIFHDKMDNTDNICGNNGKCKSKWSKEEKRLIPYCKCTKEGGCGSEDSLCPAGLCGENGKCEYICETNNCEHDKKIESYCHCDNGYINVKFNCKEKDPCANNSYCGDNGECKVEDYEPRCECNDNFIEKNLQCIENPCIDSCSENGNCELNNNNEPRCKCNEGFLEINLQCVEKENLFYYLFGSQGNEVINDMVIDNEGNIILVGSFNLTGDNNNDKLEFKDSSFNTIFNNITTNNDKNIFILKIGKEGIESHNSWIKTFGSDDGGDNEATTVTVDEDNNIYVGGYYSENMIIQGITSINDNTSIEYRLTKDENDNKSFIIALKDSGEAFYAKELKKENQTTKNYIISKILLTTDKMTNKTYLIGIANNINNAKLFSFELDNLKNPSNTYYWSTIVSSIDEKVSNETTQVNGMTLIKGNDGKNKYIGVTGSFCKDGTISCELNRDICNDGENSFECEKLKTQGGSDIFFIKFNLTNGYVDDISSIQTFGSTKNDEGIDVVSYQIPADDDKTFITHLYLTGIFNGDMTIGNTNLTDRNKQSIFVRYFKDGDPNIDDSIKIETKDDITLNKMAIDNDNNIFLAATSLEKEGFVYRVPHYLDRIDNTRTLSLGTVNTVKSIIIDKNGYKYISGEFGNITLPQVEGYPEYKLVNDTEGSFGENDIFFMKYSSDYPPGSESK